MKKSTRRKRPYESQLRSDSAADTRVRILKVARNAFARKGIEKVTIAEIAAQAKVAASTIFAIFKSKEGILRGLMEQSLFGERFQSAQSEMSAVSDPIKLIELTSHVSRAIYESESEDLGLMRSASGYSRALKDIEQEFEDIRFEMQKDRLQKLFDAGRAKSGLTFDDARRIMWMYTGRDIYHMLVHNAGWPPAKYQAWLTETLLEALVERSKV